MKNAKRKPDRSKSAPHAKKSNFTKLKGYIIWIFIGGDNDGASVEFEIQKGILRDGGNELAIECLWNLPGRPSFVYTIVMRRSGPLLFRGEWSDGGDTANSKGTCSCRVYSNGSRLALIGNWKQENGERQWVAELSPGP